jgi:hypothetical protein
MTIRRRSIFAGVFMFALLPAFAASVPNGTDACATSHASDLAESIRCEGFGANGEPNPRSWSTSLSDLPDAPDAEAIESARFGGSKRGLGRNTKLRMQTDPFSQFALGFVSGIGGFGFQAATPLATKINLRVGGNFFDYNLQVTEQGIPIEGAIRLRSLNVGVDVYPYRGGFHSTPGLTLYNGNRMTATTNIAGGQHFTINDTDYVSDPADPVHGHFDVRLGRKIAPSITMGFGNMLKRSSHWTMQTDFGVQFIGAPKFTLQMDGSVCTQQDGCGNRVLDDPGTVRDLAQQQADVNSAIQPLRFYPILTTAISYRFGHKVAMTYWR